MNSASIVAFATYVFTIAMDATATAEDHAPEPLPSVSDFEPERYLGKWYEVARLPTPIQPEGTLAVAEYVAGNEAGLLAVKNTALDKEGNKLSEIEGQARLAEGDPPGRLLVSFGPVLPQKPNYHVIHVDEDYRFAVVGVPDRNSLWILSRNVPVAEQTLKSLQKIAEKAGFDVAKLRVARWDKIPKAIEDGAGQPAVRTGSK